MSLDFSLIKKKAKFALVKIVLKVTCIWEKKLVKRNIEGFRKAELLKANVYIRSRC